MRSSESIVRDGETGIAVKRLPLETLESFHNWFEVELVKRVIEAAADEALHEAR